MIDYRRLGMVSPKPHTVFEVDGKMLAEHVFTKEGFGDVYSILYQRRAPTHETRVKALPAGKQGFPAAILPESEVVTRRHFVTPKAPLLPQLLEARTTLLANADCSVGVARFNAAGEVFFSNGDADELFFVSQGKGVLQTMFGEIDYGPHDYLFVPKACPYRFVPEGAHCVLAVEARRGFNVPKEFRQPVGQLKLDAPYSHRDFRSPERLLTLDPGSNPGIVVKRGNRLSLHEYVEWPYQVLGWDGWCWPFAFNVHAFNPKTSTVHLPPSSHLAFAAQGFVVMNFVPRIVDYHPRAIPCPYPHSSVDCDEVLFYVDGNFTSRKGIGRESISFHPGGIPHGPHPEMYERSVGVGRTDELAVMVDTFAPLFPAASGAACEDPSYHLTWNSSEGI